MRVVGLDVSRTFAEVAYLEAGQLEPGGQVLLQHARLAEFAKGLRLTDVVVLEATGNTMAIAAALRPAVAKVVIANPLRVRLIAEARIKTDKIDAAVLAQLYASGFLPEVWEPDERTQALRRQVARRAQIVRERTRLKNEIHSVLATHLIPCCPASDLFGKRGRAWLAEQPLPMDERLGVQQRLRELDRLGEDVAAMDRALGQGVTDDPAVQRLLTITGVNVAVAIGLVAAIGDIARFKSPQKLVSYFGLNPRVRQSGLAPATYGHISKLGRSHARAMLVEAAWAAAKAPVRYAGSSCASEPAAEFRSPRSPRRASWRWSCGTCWRNSRTTPGRIRRWSQARCVVCSCKPARPRVGAVKARQPGTT